MSGFSSDWLALREPADHLARRAELLDALPPPAPEARRRIVDLGTGTGSNLRYLLPRLGARQQWVLVDNDAELLSGLPGLLQAWSAAQDLSLTARARGFVIDGAFGTAEVTTRSLDLSGDLADLDLQPGDLVTCSALLDLFSAERLGALADALAASSGCALFTLSYDGRVDWSPELPFDGAATALLNAHQRRDKGLGGAAGPDAGALMVDCLRKRGYRVEARQADWRLGTTHAALQHELIAGWRDALFEQVPARRDEVLDWHRQRDAHIDTGESRLRVGHLDLVAVPG